MLNIHLGCRAVFIVVVLLSVSIAAVKADNITPNAERSSRLRGEGTRQYWEYGRSVHTESGGQDTTVVNDDDKDNSEDEDEEDIDDDAHEQLDENEDDELEDDELGPSFKHYYSSIQHYSRGLNADDDTKADEIRRENEGGSKKQSLLMKDEEMGDYEQYDANEEDELKRDGLEPSARTSKFPGMHHSRTWKKNEILERKANSQQKKATNAGDDDDEDTEDGSGDDADGSTSGGGSGSAAGVQQTSYARKLDLDVEEAKDKNSSWNDQESKPGNAAIFRSRLILEPSNETSFTKPGLEESNKAEQSEKNKEDSDNDDDISGEESGSTSDSVQGSGELTEDMIGEHPLSKPRPLNRTNLSKDRTEQRVTVFQDSKVQLRNLKAKYTEETGKPHQDVHTSSSVNATKPTIKDHEAESNQHKIAENKAEKKELHKEKVDHTFKVSKVKQNVTNKTISKLESPARKRPVEASKVSMHSPQKGLPSQNIARVTQVVKGHPKPSHTRLIGKAPSPKPQSCQSEKILSGHSLKGGTRAGQFEILGEASSMRACLQRCCSKHDCDVALLIDGRCYGVGCYSKELCLAVPVPHPHFVFSQLGYIDKGHKRGDIEFHREFLCKYGNLTLRNNEQWSGELCGGVVRCKNGVATVKKCSGIPPKPDNCAKPRLIVKHQPGKCCEMNWRCKASHCVFNNRLIKHGAKLNDPLCTGIVRCLNGHLTMEYCPQIPEKPKDCARPILKTINVPGKCCKKHWVCSDKTCRYDNIKLQHREKLTDASCAVVLECRNGFLRSKRCPGPPPVPHACINPSLQVKRLPGECCEMNWTCAIS